MQQEGKRKLGDSLESNPRRRISLRFRTADGVVEVATDSVVVPFCAFLDVPLDIFCHKGVEEGICIQVAEQTLMIAGKAEEDLIPLNLRVYGIHTFTTYLNIRTIIALSRVEEGSVDIAYVFFFIMRDPCHHEALGQSS